jgi:COX assembly protein 1
MNALSRREEDTLLKTTKAHALKECDPLVKGTPNTFIFATSLYMAELECSGAEFAECATGRTVSVAWACKAKYKEVQECISRLWVSLFCWCLGVRGLHRVVS